MNSRKIIGLFCFTVLLPGIALAQNQPQALSLKECLIKALNNNQNIAISRYEEQIGDQQIRETRARALPQVSGTGNVTDNYKRQVLVLPAGSFPGSTKDQVLTVGNVYNTGLSADASQALFDASVFTALKAAKAGKDYYKQNTKQSEEDIINQTAQVYYRILASREQVKSQDSNISKLTRIVAATQGQYDNGLARKIDLDRIKVNLTNAQTQRLQQLNQIAIQTANLKVLIGLPIETDIEPADLSLREIESQAKEFIPSSLFNVNNRTEIQVVDAQIRLRNLQTKAIRAENYPRLSAFFNYGYNGIGNVFSDYFKSGGSDIWYGVGTVGVRLNIPIFDGLARQARTRQSAIQSLELQKRREGIALSLKAGYESARKQIANSIHTISAQKENVALASEVYSSSQANYNLGLATLTDLLEAQTSYIQAQNSYTQALLDYKIAELETIRSSGNLRSLLQ